jgi:hypothetical protein
LKVETHRNGSNPESLDLHRICLRSGPGEQSRDGTLFPSVTLSLDSASATESVITSYGNTRDRFCVPNRKQFPITRSSRSRLIPSRFPVLSARIPSGNQAFRAVNPLAGINPENDIGRNRCKPEEAEAHSTEITFHCPTILTEAIPDESEDTRTVNGSPKPGICLPGKQFSLRPNPDIGTTFHKTRQMLRKGP